MGRNKQKWGETRRNKKKKEEKKKKTKTQRKKEKQYKIYKNIHVPKRQHNTTCFKLIYTIHSFFIPNCDKNTFIKRLR